MEPLRTPDFASDSARRALAVGAAHRAELRNRDSSDSLSISDRQLRVSAWDPCYDVSVDTALRSADHAMVARTAAVYAKKDEGGNRIDYSAAKAGSISSSYPSAKIQSQSPKRSS